MQIFSPLVELLFLSSLCQMLSAYGLFYASGRLVHNFGLKYVQLNSSPAIAAYIFRNHGLGSRLQIMAQHGMELSSNSNLAIGNNFGSEKSHITS